MDSLKELDENIQQLIIRYLDGEATDSELHALQAWLEQSEANVTLFSQCQKMWLQAGASSRYQPERAWKRMEQRRIVKIRRQWIRVAGVAAVLLLGIGGYWGVMEYRSVVHQQPVAVMENIEPGGAKAVLVLGSNERVELGDSAGETLLMADESIKQEGHTLIYDQKRLPEKEVYNRLITPRGGEYSVVLADGSKVWLNAESELRYPVRFVGNERKVYLKGEAYFDVAKQAGKPFVVHVDDAQITVLGTEFNVRNYHDEEIAATLVKGAVRIHDAGRKCDLTPGMQAVIEKDGIRVREVDTDLYTAWKDGYFIYRERTLEDIMKELSRWYDFTYDCRSEELRRMTLTAKLRKFDRVEDIFDILKRTGRLDFVTQGKNVTVLAK